VPGAVPCDPDIDIAAHLRTTRVTGIFVPILLALRQSTFKIT